MKMITPEAPRGVGHSEGRQDFSAREKEGTKKNPSNRFKGLALSQAE
ncbi:hypothetical protein [Collimonas sp. PA-H2]|nr:hypothetical protein [Collimonas sp. PA-H2]